ncbi:MAG: MBL fold metallo-hydrolase [Parvibaculaceae bacterium]|nr:MBL fold metallo-hydrolase [Parvibaculaceae bacterium]
MAVAVPYVREIEFEYGRADRLTPLIRRVIANNPGGFTYTGTGTYIVGNGNVAVIDPGPMLDAHLDAILKAVEGETVSHILITHTHADHSPLAAPLKALTGAKTYGFGPHGSGHPGEAVEEDGDMEFAPDVTLRHGDIVAGDGWTMEAVHTPGHTSNHLCFALLEEQALFSGDHVMGWSTSVVSPPDGDMKAYMASLRLLLDRDDAIYWPTHGPAITAPRPHVEAFIAHRQDRERQILEQLAAGRSHIAEMVPVMYAAVDKRLYPAAARSVLAHMQHMVGKGEIETDGPPGMASAYRIKERT